MGLYCHEDYTRAKGGGLVLWGWNKREMEKRNTNFIQILILILLIPKHSGHFHIKKNALKEKQNKFNLIF